MNRFWVAIGTYAVLASMAWWKLTVAIPGTRYQVRHVVIVVMAALAVSTWVHRRDRNEEGPKGGTDVRSE